MRIRRVVKILMCCIEERRRWPVALGPLLVLACRRLQLKPVARLLPTTTRSKILILCTHVLVRLTAWSDLLVSISDI